MLNYFHHFFELFDIGPIKITKLNSKLTNKHYPDVLFTPHSKSDLGLTKIDILMTNMHPSIEEILLLVKYLL